MKLLIALAATLFCLSVAIVSGTRSSAMLLDDKSSKTQPKAMTLAKDSLSDKYGEVAFNHETHSTKNYSPDGKSVIACVECHHTDQPKANLKPPLATSTSEVVLTAATLNDPKQPNVQDCRNCHLQSGDDSKPIPTVKYADRPAPVKLTNDIAYHNNCNVCHDAAIKARPELAGKIPGSASNDCLKCHKPVG